MALVTLEWYEHELAGFCGVMRTAESQRSGSTRETKRKGSQIVNDVESSGAEIAVAKLIDKFPRMGVNTHELADIGENIEVRWTDNPHGCLIIRPKDREDRIYFLVRGRMPNYDVVGCISGAVAKREEWWADPTGDGYAWWVPEWALCKPECGWVEAYSLE